MSLELPDEGGIEFGHRLPTQRRCSRNSRGDSLPGRYRRGVRRPPAPDADRRRVAVEALAEVLQPALVADLLGVEVADIGPTAFHGRCSTEENQAPETLHGWQVGNARKSVEPLGATVTAEFFEVGQSRSVPWDRREAASQMLAALKDPHRGWNAVVGGRD
jgi:hypothetical protein